MLLGKKDPATGAVSTSEDGFRVRGSDLTGKCIEDIDTDLSEMGDPILKFDVDMSYGCAIEYTLEELEQNCS